MHLSTSMPSKTIRAVGLLAICFSCACINGEAESVGASRGELAQEGPWSIPADVRALAASQQVTLTDPGRWVGTRGCSGTFSEGARTFATYLMANFPQISSYGGYSCRPIVGDSQWMSVHATGRALDLFIPVDRSVVGEGKADNTAGDEVANWLIANAQYIGIQRVIWDRWLWQSEDWGDGLDTPYNSPGSNPHNDHIHMELSVEASQRMTDFFRGTMSAPVPPTGCAALPAGGGTIDNDNSCFQSYGSESYWRHVNDAGIGGSYIWTNASGSAVPSNFARWALNVTSAGTYTVEAHLVPEHSVFTRAHYDVTHAGAVDTVTIDQSAHAEEWVTLGDFDFVAGGGQSVTLYDNDTTDTVLADQHISFDAIRITNVARGTDSPADDPWGNVDGSPTPAQQRAAGCAVSVVSPTTSAPLVFAMLLTLAVLRRRASARIRNRRLG